MCDCRIPTKDLSSGARRLSVLLPGHDPTSVLLAVVGEVGRTAPEVLALQVRR